MKVRTFGLIPVAARAPTILSSSHLLPTPIAFVIMKSAPHDTLQARSLKLREEYTNGPEADPNVRMLRHTWRPLPIVAGRRCAERRRNSPNSVSCRTRARPLRSSRTSAIFSIGRFPWRVGSRNGTIRSPWHGKRKSRVFHETLRAFDEYLASGKSLACSTEMLFQGPVADALTHVGQLTILRRAAGTPIHAENYAKAEIVAGRIGPEQTAPHREF